MRRKLRELSEVRKVQRVWIEKVFEEEVEKMKPPVELEVRKPASEYIQPSTEVNI